MKREEGSYIPRPWTIEEWCHYVRLYRDSKGFITARENMLEKLMLVVTELAEAAEDVRHAKWDHFEEEIADTVIRLFDIAGSLEFDLEKAIRDKMAVNVKRPFLHGKLA